MIFNTSIGIKQIIRFEWMNYTVDLLKSGLTKDEIRRELHLYLSDKKGNGKLEDRAEKTMSIAVSLLMNIWINPKPGLEDFRDRLLKIFNQENKLICHWAMTSSVYPFWFNMSYIIGSLFRLQDQIKKSQIMSRTYELLGEKNTIERCSRYVIRSFVYWDIIRDKEKLGFYEKGEPSATSDINLICLLIESIFYAVQDERIPLNLIINCPAFFNFSLPLINCSQIIKGNQNLYLEQFSVNEEYICKK